MLWEDDYKPAVQLSLYCGVVLLQTYLVGMDPMVPFNDSQSSQGIEE